MRKRFSEEERQRFFEELARSGDSVWAVAERIGLNRSTAYRWVANRPTKKPTFARVVRAAAEVERQRSGVSAEVGGARIVVEPVFDTAVLRAVVAALSGSDK